MIHITAIYDNITDCVEPDDALIIQVIMLFSKNILTNQTYLKLVLPLTEKTVLMKSNRLYFIHFHSSVS